MFLVGVLIISNDLFEFIKELTNKITAKSAFSAGILVALAYLIFSIKKMNTRVSDMIHHERKANRKI